MLKKNIINPKYRKLVWVLVVLGIGATWVPTLTKFNADYNGVSFTHFDQELSVSCILDQTARGVTWECKKNQSLELMNFDPEPKYWVYETDEGEVTVKRSINLGVATLDIEHPKFRKKYSAVIE